MVWTVHFIDRVSNEPLYANSFLLLLNHLFLLSEAFLCLCDPWNITEGKSSEPSLPSPSSLPVFLQLGCGSSLANFHLLSSLSSCILSACFVTGSACNHAGLLSSFVQASYDISTSSGHSSCVRDRDIFTLASRLYLSISFIHQLLIQYYEVLHRSVLILMRTICISKRTSNFIKHDAPARDRMMRACQLHGVYTTLLMHRGAETLLGSTGFADGNLAQFQGHVESPLQ